ncbi:MAG: hypothetical protein HZB53_22005 [Chloroflexi bacterium]|nr:hypothetical protein [Chloroflexota bacterium]
MPPLTGAFAAVLKAGRETFNARFVEARRIHAALDGAEFLDFLRGTVAPVVAAAHATRPDATATVAQVLYDLSLELLCEDILGARSRYPHIGVAWRDLLPALAAHLAAAPRAVAGSVTNALYNLSQVPGARPAEWIESMRALAPLCADGDTLLRGGQVAAWRAGLAHYRTGALDLCGQLPAPVVHAALDASPAARQMPVADLIARLRAEPWRKASQIDGKASAGQLKIVARAGAFRGFGGLFLAPPTVTPAGGQFIASDAQTGAYLLSADAYGATFHRADGMKASPSLGPFKLDRGGRVTLGKLSCTFPELTNATSAASDGTTLAVTTALSHAVWLVAAV